MDARPWGLLATVLALAGCSGDAQAPREITRCTGDYCTTESWLCRPDLGASDQCMAPQSATVFAPDGSTSIETLPKAEAPAVDCFYVYPTVAIGGALGNVPDYSNLNEILVPLRAQAAPFAAHCRVFAPLYHQITLTTYQSPEADAALEVAYADVAAAFDVYLQRWNAGRDFILLGHSQGSHMTRRLLQRRVETDPALLARLVVALPIGPVGDLWVPRGARIGGSFAKLPLCGAPDERGCIVAYDSQLAGSKPAVTPKTDVPDADVPCVNPAGDGLTRLRGAYMPTRKNAGQFGASAPDLPTDFAVYRDLYTASCETNDQGLHYLGVAMTPAPGDVRELPKDPSELVFPGLGLHLLDYTYPLEDLLALVATKIAASR